MRCRFPPSSSSSLLIETGHKGLRWRRAPLELGEVPPPITPAATSYVPRPHQLPIMPQKAWYDKSPAGLRRGTALGSAPSNLGHAEISDVYEAKIEREPTALGIELY